VKDVYERNRAAGLNCYTGSHINSRRLLEEKEKKYDIKSNTSEYNRWVKGDNPD